MDSSKRGLLADGLCGLGCALFFVASPLGYAGSLLLRMAAPGWSVLTLMVTYLAGMALSCGTVRVLARRNPGAWSSLRAARVALAASLALTAVQLACETCGAGAAGASEAAGETSALGATSGWMFAGAVFLAGLFNGYLTVRWYDGFTAICRRRGGATCMLIGILFGGATVVLAVLLNFAAGHVGEASLYAFPCALLVGAWACLEASERLAPGEKALRPAAIPTVLDALDAGSGPAGARRASGRPPAPDGRGADYRLSPFVLLVFTSYGMARAVATGAPLVVGAAQPVLASATLLVAVLIPMVLACVSAARSRGEGRAAVRIGVFVRVSVVVGGAALAFMPLVGLCAPDWLGVFCDLVNVFLGISLLVYTISVCFGSTAPSMVVLAANHMVYAAANGVGCLVVWAILAVSGDGGGLGATGGEEGGLLAWYLMSLVSTVAALAVVFVLPSRGSEMQVLALHKYPEDESFAERAERVAAQLALERGLTAREQTVLVELFCGKTSQEIAASLQLSNWTVRDYITSIHAKLDVHSVQELLMLVNGAR